MNVIRIDTKLLIKEQKEHPTLIIKSEGKIKDNSTLQIDFNPIAIHKQYPILITIMKGFSKEIKNIKTDISTKLNDKDINLIYKPTNDRLFYLGKLNIDNYSEEISQNNNIIEAGSVLNLQTKTRDKVFSIFDKNKSLIVLPIIPGTSPEPVISEYHDFITQLINFKNNFQEIDYYLEKRLYPAVDVWLEPSTNTINITMFGFQDLDIYFLQIYLGGRLIYLYDDNSKPLKILQTKYKYENLEKVLKRFNLRIYIKVKDKIGNQYKVDIFMNLLFSFNVIDYIKVYGELKNYFNQNIIRQRIPISFGTITDNIKMISLINRTYFNQNIIRQRIPISFGTITDNIKMISLINRTYFNQNIIRNPQIKERLQLNDTLTYKAPYRYQLYTMNLIKNLYPI